MNEKLPAKLMPNGTYVLELAEGTPPIKAVLDFNSIRKELDLKQGTKFEQAIEEAEDYGDVLPELVEELKRHTYLMRGLFNEAEQTSNDLAQDKKDLLRCMQLTLKMVDRIDRDIAKLREGQDKLRDEVATLKERLMEKKIDAIAKREDRQIVVQPSDVVINNLPPAPVNETKYATDSSGKQVRIDIVRTPLDQQDPEDQEE